MAGALTSTPRKHRGAAATTPSASATIATAASPPYAISDPGHPPVWRLPSASTDTGGRSFLHAEWEWERSLGLTLGVGMRGRLKLYFSRCITRHSGFHAILYIRPNPSELGQGAWLSVLDTLTSRSASAACRMSSQQINIAVVEQRSDFHFTCQQSHTTNKNQAGRVVEVGWQI